MGFHGKSDLFLIIESKLVPHRQPGRSDGLKVEFGDKLQPANIEFSVISGNNYVIEIFFNKPIPNRAAKTHIDATVRHPDGFDG